MCCLFAHHSIPSFNLTGSSFCVCKCVFECACMRAPACLPAYLPACMHLFFFRSVPLWLILQHSLQAYCISDVHRHRGCFFTCIVCFAFLFLPLLLLSLSLSSLSLISGLKSLDILLQPQKPTMTEWKSCNNQPKPTFCSPLCCYFALQSVSLSLSQRPPFAAIPRNFVSFSLSLSLYHVP